MRGVLTTGAKELPRNASWLVARALKPVGDTVGGRAATSDPKSLAKTGLTAVTAMTTMTAAIAVAQPSVGGRKGREGERQAAS
ncbi:MAG: hypothetical protein M3Z50_08190 [Actinomycetota bacterium]|nr:hypothetical protein [Actinomycetota bacterium]